MMGSKIGNKKGGGFLRRLWRNVGNGSLAQLILNLGTRWRRVVSFTARAALFPQKGPRELFWTITTREENLRTCRESN